MGEEQHLAWVKKPTPREAIQNRNNSVSPTRPRATPGDRHVSMHSQVREEYESYRAKKALELDEQMKTKMMRRPDERNEDYARKLGFRDGELIGGY